MSPGKVKALYGDRIAVIGLSSEEAADVRRMTSPRIRYAVAVDARRRMDQTVGVQAIPQALLIDPNGILHLEGHPGYVCDRAGLERLPAKYSN